MAPAGPRGGANRFAGHGKEDARRVARANGEFLRSDITSLGSLGHAYGRAGRPDQSRGILVELHERGSREEVPAFVHAMVHVGLGDHERALTLLERASGIAMGGCSESRRSPHSCRCAAIRTSRTSPVVWGFPSPTRSQHRRDLDWRRQCAHSMGTATASRRNRTGARLAC
jgi:hypothetical protein